VFVIVSSSAPYVNTAAAKNPNTAPHYRRVGGEATRYYCLSADGLLMPAKEDQAPPDLRYFKQTRK
jgi:hypothetical protein